MSQFKPLLAVQADDLSLIKYPKMVSPKLDGIRAIVIDGVIVSRNLKPIKNKYIQSILSHSMFSGLDGELIVGSPMAKTLFTEQLVDGGTIEMDEGVFRNTSSGVMSADGEPDFTYWVFDNYLDSTHGFEDRYKRLENWYDKLPSQYRKHIKILPHMTVHSESELDAYEEAYLTQGYEGAMLRSLDGKYKFGRSTLKEEILLKVKRFSHMEVEILGKKERMHNANEATTDALGRTERSSHKENLIGRGDLGALIVREYGKTDSKDFSVGSGFDDKQRKWIWENFEEFKKNIGRIKFFAYGEYEVPRFPVWDGIRDKSDMSE